ncbi:MAG: N-6 DNA methylase, partial [candidate division Zixibacteria bacterium]|nr:N-6 DNA methylase [candidate division Zixibacteria bacterium]
IPPREKHEMGQYFTPPSTVDLINSFCIQNPNNVILDLGCGAGTFLVRAHARLKYLKRKKTHKELLEQLWGVDKASFPAHLAQINLVLPGLSKTENFPYIENKDAFDIIPQESYFEVPYHRRIKHEYKKISSKLVKVKVPDMNAVVGNPPYIRQEKIEGKDHIRSVIEKEWGNFRVTNQTGISIGSQADIYVYFFIHGARFLKEGGRLGFVTSNSWLDVRYGAGLQKFFLDNFKIIAVIESKVERSFAKADINTAITIVERCSDKRKRDNNLVRFVVLKEKMDNLIPKDGDKDRFLACENLISKITRSKKLHEDSQIRVLPKKQKELYQEGIEDKVYVGSKWGGKYLRAPDIFFKILDKGKDLFVPLKDVAEVRRGFTTGANDFFYLTDEHIKAHKIEKEFLKPLIKSPRESRKILISAKDIRYKVLLVHEEKQQLRRTNVLKYIYWGEEKEIHKRPTCSPRPRWYDLGKRETANILWTEFFFDTHITFLLQDAIFDSDKFYGIIIKRYVQETAAFLNSTIAVLFRHLLGFPSLGEGALKIPVYELSSFQVVNFRKTPISIRRNIRKSFSKICQREILPIFEEIHQKDRQELDNIFFDILGLTEKERQQVYDAVCELVRNRLEKAKTFGKKNANKKEEFNPSTYADHILEEIFLTQDKREFPKDFVNPNWETFSIQLPKIEPKGKLTIEEFFGKASLRIDGETIDCQTTPKANFVVSAIEKGIRDKVTVPADDKSCIKAVRDYMNYRKIIQTQIEGTMKMFNLTKKQTKAVLSEVENRY